MSVSVVQTSGAGPFGGGASVSAAASLYPFDFEDTCSLKRRPFSDLMREKFAEGNHYIRALVHFSHNRLHFYDALETLKEFRNALQKGEGEIALLDEIPIGEIHNVYYYATRKLKDASPLQPSTQEVYLGDQKRFSTVRHHNRDEYDGTIFEALTDGELEENPRALYALSHYFLGEGEASLQMYYLRRAAAVKSSPAQRTAAAGEGVSSSFVLPKYVLARELVNSVHPGEQVLEEARKLFKEVSLCRDPQDNEMLDALYRYGLMQLRGQGGEKDPQGALRSFEEAAEQGHANAAWEVGLLLKNRSFSGHNLERSVEFLLKAAEGVDPSVWPSLSVDIARAYSSQGKFAEAETWFERAIRDGERGADKELEAMRRRRDGCPPAPLEGKSKEEIRAALLSW